MDLLYRAVEVNDIAGLTVVFVPSVPPRYRFGNETPEATRLAA